MWYAAEDCSRSVQRRLEKLSRRTLRVGYGEQTVHETKRNADAFETPTLLDDEVRRRGMTVPGHKDICKPEQPACNLSVMELQLSIEAHTGTPPAADWKRPPGRPQRNWLQQLEEDTGLSVGAAWITGQDRSMWRTLRPSAGQAQQWVSEWILIKIPYDTNKHTQRPAPREPW